MQHEISVGFLWKCLKKSWITILVASLVVALIVGIVVSFVPKKYSSTIDFYVVNTNTSYDYTTAALLAASAYLINDYVELIRSDEVLDQVTAYMNEGKDENNKVTNELLRGMISAEAESNTSLFTIRVSHTDPEFAYEVACAIQDIAPAAVTKIAKPDRLTNEYLVNVVRQSIDKLVSIDSVSKDDIKDFLADSDLPDDTNTVNIVENALGELSSIESVSDDEIKAFLKEAGLDSSQDCFRTVNPPIVDKIADSPSIKKFVAISAGATALLIYAIFFVKGLFQMNIYTEEEVKKHVKYPLIGTIPHWDDSAKTSKPSKDIKR